MFHSFELSNYVQAAGQYVQDKTRQDSGWMHVVGKRKYSFSQTVLTFNIAKRREKKTHGRRILYTVQYTVYSRQQPTNQPAISI